MVAVVHDDKVEYAVVGDTGPWKIIGEASHATAKALGIDPDPATVGADSGVPYILFKDSQCSPVESHSAAVALGRAAGEAVRAGQLSLKGRARCRHAHGTGPRPRCGGVSWAGRSAARRRC